MTEKKTQNKTCDYMHLKHLYSMYVFCSELVSSVISIPDPLSNPTIFFFHSTCPLYNKVSAYINECKYS